MDMQELHERMDRKLDRIEDKLDQHLDRIAKTEADISWMRGHIKIIVTLATSLISGVIAIGYKLLVK